MHRVLALLGLLAPLRLLHAARLPPRNATALPPRDADLDGDSLSDLPVDSPFISDMEILWGRDAAGGQSPPHGQPNYPDWVPPVNIYPGKLHGRGAGHGGQLPPRAACKDGYGFCASSGLCCPIGMSCCGRVCCGAGSACDGEGQCTIVPGGVFTVTVTGTYSTTVTVTSTSTLEETSTVDQTVTDALTVTVTDGGGGVATSTVWETVTAPAKRDPEVAAAATEIPAADASSPSSSLSLSTRETVPWHVLLRRRLEDLGLVNRRGVTVTWTRYVTETQSATVWQTSTRAVFVTEVHTVEETVTQRAAAGPRETRTVTATVTAQATHAPKSSPKPGPSLAKSVTATTPAQVSVKSKTHPSTTTAPEPPPPSLTTPKGRPGGYGGTDAAYPSSAASYSSQAAPSATGAIVGGVIGGLLFICIFGFVAWMFWRKRRVSTSSARTTGGANNGTGTGTGTGTQPARNNNLSTGQGAPGKPTIMPVAKPTQLLGVETAVDTGGGGLGIAR